MGAQFLISNVVPGSAGAARTQVKDGGSSSLSGAAGAAVVNRMVRVPDGSALFIYGDS